MLFSKNSGPDLRRNFLLLSVFSLSGKSLRRSPCQSFYGCGFFTITKPSSLEVADSSDTSTVDSCKTVSI